MREISFFVDGPRDASGRHPLPGMNEVVAENRRGFGAGNRLKRRMTELAEVAARSAVEEAGWVAPLGPAEVRMEWHELSRRRDLDNVVSAQKFVLDGMVEAGLLRGDSQRYVPCPVTHEVVVDRDRPGVAVTVTRLEAPAQGGGWDKKEG